MDTLTSNKLQCSKSCGSESYYSPEIKESLTPYDPMKSDVFSLAVMMMTLMRGINLFTANVGNSNFQYCQIKCGEFKGFWNKLSFAEVFSVEFKDLMEKMLTYDPTNRISLEEVKNHKWFRGETFNKDELKEFFNKFEVYLLKESGSKKNSKYESFPKKVKKDQN
jgi:serine/threonine protein kinase